MGLTTEGRALVDRLLPGLHRVETDAMGALAPAERLELFRLLAKIQVSVLRVRQQPPSLPNAPRNRPARLDGNRSTG